MIVPAVEVTTTEYVPVLTVLLVELPPPQPANGKQDTIASKVNMHAIFRRRVLNGSTNSVPNIKAPAPIIHRLCDGDIPAVIVAVVEKVSVVFTGLLGLPSGVTVVGLKMQDPFAGTPTQEKEICWLNPVCGMMKTTPLPVLPAAIVREGVPLEVVDPVINSMV